MNEERLRTILGEHLRKFQSLSEMVYSDSGFVVLRKNIPDLDIDLLLSAYKAGIETKLVAELYKEEIGGGPVLTNEGDFNTRLENLEDVVKLIMKI